MTNKSKRVDALVRQTSETIAAMQAPSPTEKALAKSLAEMVEVYGGSDDLASPIDIITRAVKAIRRVKPKYKFEDY